MRPAARFIRAGGALVLFFIIAAAAHAETPSGGDGSQTGDGSTRFTGLAQAPEANLFIGAATTSIPFLVPPGRKNLTPQLAVTYTSQAGASAYGYGWDLAIPRIQRSTKHGVLACDESYWNGADWEILLAENHRDEFVVTLPGGSAACRRNAAGTCIPDLEESFLKIVYDDADNTWRVWDKSGNRYEFGATNTATTSTAAEPATFDAPARTGSDTSVDFQVFGSLTDPLLINTCNYTFSWALTAIIDPNGNRVDVRYRLLDGVLYPHRLRYGSDSDASHPFEARFVWQTRANDDQPLTGNGGFAARLTRRLQKLEVYSQQSLLRWYGLTYATPFGGAGGVKRGRQSFLDKVTLYDKDNLALANAAGQPAAAVAGYQPTTSGFATTIQLAAKPQFRNGTMPNALRWVDQGHTERDVFDINGDGFPDIVDAYPVAACGSNCRWDIYLGSRHGFSTTATPWHLPVPSEMHVIRGANAGRTTVDLTGDGIADFVHASSGEQQYWHVYPGTPFAAGGGWGFASTYIRWRAPDPYVQSTSNGNSSFQGWSNGTAVLKDLMDMTGDGRPDWVAAAAYGTFEVWPNTGSGFGPPQAVLSAFNALSFSTVENGLVYGTFDMNGDGLPDQVWSGQGPSAGYTGSWKVCLNGGLEMAQLNPQPGEAACEDWAVPQYGSWRFIRKSIGTEPLDTVRDLFDINGDGLPDIVDRDQWSSVSGWQVFLNRGNGFEQQAIVWPAPQFIRNGSPGGGGTMADTFDVNGDGIVDNVVFNDSGSTYSLRHPNGGAWRRDSTNTALAEPNPNKVRPDLLVESARGTGASTVLRYRPSTQWLNHGGDGITDLPFVTWTVTEIRHRDGLCPPAQTATDGSCADATHELGTTLDYEGGRFDPVEREFRGFNRVWAKPTAPAGTARAATLTIFHQTAAKSGKIESSTTYDASGTDATHPLAKVLNDWECAHPQSGTAIACPVSLQGDAWIRLRKTTQRTYANFSTTTYRDAVTENLAWHDCPAPGGGTRTYGNVAHAYRGDADPAGARLYTRTEYACRDTANGYLADRPKRVVVKDRDDSAVLEEKWFWYDGLDYGQVVDGNTTRVESLLDVNDLNPVPACAQRPADGCAAATMTVDGDGNVTAVTDAFGRQTTTTYDAHGLYPRVVTRPPPAAGEAAHKTLAFYDPGCGVLLEQGIPYTAAEPGATERTRHAYDTFCRRTKTWLPGDAGDAKPYVRNAYVVGAANRPTVTTVTQREPSHQYGEYASSTLADGLGRVLQQKGESVIDGTWGILATSTDYDALGRPWRTHAPFVAPYLDGFETVSTAPGDAVTERTLDALGRTRQVTFPDGSFRTIDPHTVAWETTTRDECANDPICTGSRTVEKRDALGRASERWVYDDGNAVLGRTRWNYDALDRVVRTEQGDAQGGGWAANTAVLVDYDTLGRKVRVDDPDSGTWFYRYDRVGNLILQDDPKADQHIEFCYDGMDRVTKKYFVPAGPAVLNCGLTADVRWTYTGALYGLGLPERITDTSGQTYVPEYTVRGEPRRVQRIMDNATAETGYEYNSVGRVTRTMYPDGEVVAHGYDSVGRPKSLQNDGGGPRYLDRITYDRFGRVRRIEHGNGAVDERTYRTAAADRFRLERIRATSAATTLFEYEYKAYTKNGQITTVEDDGWQASQPGLMQAGATYGYDGAGRLTSASGGGIGSRGYGYDEWGNIRSKEGYTFTYDSSRPHRVASFSGNASGTVDHDDNGNRSERDAAVHWGGQVYSYDLDDRLRRAVVGAPLFGAPAVDYAYDAGGRRTRERRGVLQANGTVQATQVVRHYSDLYEVTTNLAASPVTYTVRKSYVAGGLLIASRELPAPAYFQVALGGPGGGTAYAAAAPGVGESGGAVALHVAFGQNPLARVTLAATAANLAGGGLLLLLGVWLLAPGGRRPRPVLGWRLRRADACAASVLILLGSSPWPLQVRPAAAQCDPTPTPTAVPLPQIHHYHLDHLGSPQTVTTGSGTVFRQIRYDPYGTVRGRWSVTHAPTGLTAQDRREFTGYELDPLTQLSHAGAREYDPALATFLTHDPAREFASPYTYTNWDPVNLADPSGMCVWDLCIAEAILIGAAIGFTANAIQAAVSGASVGEVFKAGAIGAGLGAVGAGVGIVVGSAVGPIATAAFSQSTAPAVAGMVKAAMFVGGIGQAVHGASQGNYTGVIGLGLSVGLGFALAQGANGISQEQQLRGNAGSFDQRYRIGGSTYGGREAASGSWLGTIGNAAGVIWNLPNTVIGTAYGLLGIPTGGIGFEYGQLQFKGNLLQWLLSGGGNGAITLGDTGVYPPGFGPETVTQPSLGITLGFEESFHSLQGRVLGPLYLPAHVALGTTAVLANGYWHGPVNLLEVGPHAAPPRIF